ncbi:hypothetical protein [Taibaiella chishuiensis]|uniref:Lipocalin-like protein n=1 Tax=Taibaiella chishuiensis TaxID=1434707 RepID=A0A2P8CY47_9BACT|nr:hypothetical protein [Taibaiella chishuiensis]PSK89885.1 hypothetical protein B0I18_110186 [Taibaiella chishuiensis]
MKHLSLFVCVALLSLGFTRCSDKSAQPTPVPNPLDKLLGKYKCNDSFYIEEVITSSIDGSDRSRTSSGSTTTDIEIAKVSETKFVLILGNPPGSKDTITYKGEFYTFYWSSPHISNLVKTREIQFFADQDSIYMKDDSRDQYYESLKPEDNDIVRVHRLRLLSGKKM